MAKRVITESDLSGEPDAETVSFAFDGTAYTVDLTEAEKEELAKVLKPYLDVAEEATSTGQASIPTQPTGPDPVKVRKWASENGIEIDGKPISDRGRVPKPFVEAYEKAMRETADA
ncbi:Lsr2 family protein [Streptomyces sp. NBC_00075]|uniref:histone-like nucleoid-structuring protein Lsr2 n=1 Tax=Streptomyces sp. NBC_00075 TaxID=2975641 RepID=UPI00324846BC